MNQTKSDISIFYYTVERNTDRFVKAISEYLDKQLSCITKIYQISESDESENNINAVVCEDKNSSNLNSTKLATVKDWINAKSIILSSPIYFGNLPSAVLKFVTKCINYQVGSKCIGYDNEMDNLHLKYPMLTFLPTFGGQNGGYGSIIHVSLLPLIKGKCSFIFPPDELTFTTAAIKLIANYGQLERSNRKSLIAQFKSIAVKDNIENVSETLYEHDDARKAIISDDDNNPERDNTFDIFIREFVYLTKARYR
ncbi:hypothetical protein GJ496_002686 [Pomphorhynchus laevis]|nr:hypothetical protein GJ496_002686 [Pomphorhynchus laevis]